ncbi:class I SAM-dependent methyltransferase [Sulfurospirillum cavolei]|uniref:class I SAM-dependent methyltransferase n=1 Tax=Sulfurospirillum cavolei TaxID=366522 RepID=UPI0005A5FB04|nr:class I SAM-dependent methyltransferase [Sulfurospirillum cavolei]
MRCKICNFETVLWKDPQYAHDYYTCPHCEGIFLDARFYPSSETEQNVYANHHNSLENEGYVRMFENFIDFFWDTLHVKESLLDFGSGPTPVLSELLHRRNVRVDCYDKWYQPQKIYTDRIYDGITSTEVFEHLDDPIAILNELTVHVHQGGIVALMTLFHPKMQADFFQWWYRRDPTHITFYTPKTIEIMAKRCGFEMIKTDGRRIAVLRKR